MADNNDVPERYEIWQETTTVPGGYLPTISIGPAGDGARTSVHEATPELIGTLARYLTDVLTRGLSEAALIKSFRQRNMEDEMLGATIAELRENYPKSKSPVGMTVYHGVSLFTGEAFYTVHLDGQQERGLWSAEELRSFISGINELVSTAEWDNFVFRQLTEVVGIDENAVRAMIHSAGEHR